MSTPEENLGFIKNALRKADSYSHAARVVSFDQETICPSKAMEQEGDLVVFLSNEAYKITKTKEFVNRAEELYQSRNSLSPLDKALAEKLHRNFIKENKLTPSMNKKIGDVFNVSYLKWLEAKKASDFSIFAPSLKQVANIDRKLVSIRLEKQPTPYDDLLGDYERGISIGDIDNYFNSLKSRIIPLLKKIEHSDKKIRTDFLSRKVSVSKQAEFSDYLLKTIGFDFSCGTISTTEHPFTNELGEYDNRVTTHYYENMFISNIFTVVHEGGHAIFGQCQPKEQYECFLQDSMSMGMHESVSRFYENRIGRSKAFIHLIYPKFEEIFGDIFADVSENELYEGVNLVTPSLIRTEADELTYSLHIIIRYELEKQIVNDKIDVKKLPGMWNDLYEKYLGIRPTNDREGILQDVHWASGFGYFPTYALGNAYNAMYYNKMKEDIDIDKAVSEGKFDLIRDWMSKHVFAKANLLDAKSWLKDITGREFTSDDYIKYLEDKYTELYNLK